MITQTDVSAALRAAGLREGALVFVHAAMKPLGWLERGPDTVIDGLLDVLGPKGTLVMPTFTWPDFPGTFEVPVVQENSPIWTGKIPARFAEYPGVKRDRHPAWSNAYHGPLSDELLEINEREVYGYGKNKIHWRIKELGGSTMLVGATFKSCSSMYVPLDILELPCRQIIKTRAGTSVEQYLQMTPQEQHRMHFFENEKPQAGARPQLLLIEEPLRQAGVLREVPLGNGSVKHVSLEDLYRVMFDGFEENSKFLTAAAS